VLLSLGKQQCSCKDTGDAMKEEEEKEDEIEEYKEDAPVKDRVQFILDRRKKYVRENE